MTYTLKLIPGKWYLAALVEQMGQSITDYVNIPFNSPNEASEYQLRHTDDPMIVGATPLLCVKIGGKLILAGEIN